MRGYAWRPEHRAPRGEQSESECSHRVPVSPPPAATASRALILRSSPFRSQMEPKKSSPQHQPRAMEAKKSSHRGAGAAAANNNTAETPLSSLFYPPAPVVRFLMSLSCSMLCLHMRFALDVDPFFSLTLLFTMTDDTDGFLPVQAHFASYIPYIFFPFC